MRVCFIGAVRFSWKALEKLLEMAVNVVGVCTLQQAPSNSDFRDLRPLCEASGIPSRYAPDINAGDNVQWIAGLRPDVVLCFGWPRLIKEPLLRVAHLGVVGYHPAALPANRGRHPLIWALALGLEHTASTFFFMDEEADSGDILHQVQLAIEPYDDACSMYEKMTACALSQMEQFIPMLVSGRYRRVPQNRAMSNVWRKRGKADGKIDWRMSAVGIHNLVRALTHPYVGAHFDYADAEVRVWRSEPVHEAPCNIEPGKILAVSNMGVLVKCGEGAIRLIVTEPKFRPRIGEYL